MTIAPVRGRWLREPLLHFLIIGIGLFLLYQFIRGGNESAPREIVISESRIEALAENFGRTWMRPPTPQELRGLVDDYVKEEVFYREAIAMGLDRDDTVIRRRLRQKMEFVSEDAATTAEPTDAQLQQFLAAHAEKFVEPARVSFQQVFVNPERRGDAARRDAERILAELQAGRGPANPAEAGDPTLLPAELERCLAPGGLRQLWRRLRQAAGRCAGRPMGRAHHLVVRPASRARQRTKCRHDARARRHPPRGLA